MSSYLNFYVVPKKEYKINGKESEPLHICSISRNNEIYQAFQESISPVFVGMEETHYTELTAEKMKQVVSDYSTEVKRMEKQYQNKCDIIEKLTKVEEETIDELVHTKEYLDEITDALKELNFINDIVYDISIGCSDFEKVLINVG